MMQFLHTLKSGVANLQNPMGWKPTIKTFVVDSNAAVGLRLDSR